jgi:hypothetical protein
MFDNLKVTIRYVLLLIVNIPSLSNMDTGGEEKLRIAIINPDKCKPKKCK